MFTVGWPLVSPLVIFPLIGSLFCLGPWFSQKSDPSGRFARMWAGAVSGLTLVFLMMMGRFVVPDREINFPLEEAHQWIPSLGISLRFTFDGLTFAFCFLTAIVSLVVMVWSVPAIKNTRAYYSLMLAAEGAVMGAFTATDLILFFVFYELMLLPVLACIALWGGERRLNAALKFLVYTVAGSVMMFVAILYIGWKGRSTAGPNFAFDIHTLGALQFLSPAEQLALGVAFLLAFAVKIPIVPFHSWLPDTYREAPHAVAAFTAALLGKVAIYAVIRFMWPLFPAFMTEYGVIFAALGATAVVYGALLAMVQRDIRLLLAYSSISHLGFCVLGLGSDSSMALSGTVFQCVSHGIVTAALFLMFGTLIDREQSRDFASFGGLAGQLPGSSLLLMIFTLGAVALPLTSSFVGEFLILMGTYPTHPGWTLVALVGVVLGAVYMLTAYMNVMFGAPRVTSGSAQGRDVGGIDALVLSTLAALVVVLGIWPGPLLQIVEPAVKAVEGGATVVTTVASEDTYLVMNVQPSHPVQ